MLKAVTKSGDDYGYVFKVRDDLWMYVYNVGEHSAGRMGIYFCYTPEAWYKFGGFEPVTEADEPAIKRCKEMLNRYDPIIDNVVFMGVEHVPSMKEMMGDEWDDDLYGKF